MKTKTVFLSFGLGLALTFALLGFLHPNQEAAAAEAGVTAIRCVKPGGGSGCYAHIQDAVNVSNDGDVIRVAEGLYAETVLVTESLTLEGGWNSSFSERDWDLHPTEVNGGRAGSVIYMDGDVTTTIEGFIITGGDASGFLGWGGGILAVGDWGEGGFITIRHNLISDNIACSGSCQGFGGGIMIYANRFAIEYNTVISNVARSAGSGTGRGGGMALWGYPSSGTILENSIISNTAVYSPSGGYTAGMGGGIFSEGNCDIMATGNEIRDNYATVEGMGYGGGVYACGSYHENRILTNTASVNGEGLGGGVYSYYTPEFRDNVVEHNVASINGDGSGGGIYVIYMSAAEGNTIVDNRAKRGGGVFYNDYVGNQEFHHNRVAENWATGLDLASQDGGGGISSAADWVEITNNDILTNNAMAGGGILVTGGDRYVVNQNNLVGNWAIAGGGMFVYSATGDISQNQILDNHAIWWGGGMYLSGKASPALDGNTVMRNIAGGYSGFAGGGMIIEVNAATHVTVTNHLIADNSVDSETAGGVHCVSGSCSLIHCTIVDNKLGANPGEGVRIGAAGGVNVVWNNIIAGHDSGVIFGSGATAQMGYNDYYDNNTNVSGGSAGSHNYFVDPLFVDWLGSNFHLSADSPLINQGDASVNVAKDIDGMVRIAPPDIGADEFTLISYLSVMLRN